MTRYRTIVADPPWKYERFPFTERTGHDNRVVPGAFVARSMPYTFLSVQDIEALRVADLALPDCRLFLWTTNRYLPDSFRVLGSWGFKYRQTLIWHKTDGGPFLASVAPNTVEFLLVATRGRPERLGRIQAQIMRVPAVRDHSTKPDAFLDLVETVSPGPYLELFARRNRLGWDTWGDEALEHVEVVT